MNDIVYATLGQYKHTEEDVLQSISPLWVPYWNKDILFCASRGQTGFNHDNDIYLYSIETFEIVHVYA